LLSGLKTTLNSFFKLPQKPHIVFKIDVSLYTIFLYIGCEVGSVARANAKALKRYAHLITCHFSKGVIHDSHWR